MDSLISFIIPMYNMELYIDNCVKSIQSQFLKEEEYEVIIVDDGSTDSSLDICLEIARSNHNIKVFHQDNQGVGAARNKGIELSSGEWLTFIDSDDYYFEGAFSDILSNNLSNLQVLRFQKKTVPDNHLLEEGRRGGSIIYHGTGLNYLMKFGIDVYSTLVIIKKSFLLDNKILFSHHFFAEDELFMCKVLLANPIIATVSNEVYAYVKRNSAVTKNRELAHMSKCVRSHMDIVKQISLLSQNENRVVRESITISIRKNTLKWLLFRLIGSDINYREGKQMIDILNSFFILPVPRRECSKYWFYFFSNSLSYCPAFYLVYKAAYRLMKSRIKYK